MSFSNSLETDVLTYFFTTARAPDRPTTWFLGLHHTGNDPGETVSGTELSGNAYAQQSIGSMTVSGNNASNAGAIEFPIATGTSIKIFGHSSTADIAGKLNDVVEIQSEDVTVTAYGVRE